MYFMLILVSGAKIQLPLQLGGTDTQTIDKRVNGDWKHTLTQEIGVL